jgi:hypothetical protein
MAFRSTLPPQITSYSTVTVTQQFPGMQTPLSYSNGHQEVDGQIRHRKSQTNRKQVMGFVMSDKQVVYPGAPHRKATDRSNTEIFADTLPRVKPDLTWAKQVPTIHRTKIIIDSAEASEYGITGSIKDTVRILGNRLQTLTSYQSHGIGAGDNTLFVVDGKLQPAKGKLALDTGRIIESMTIVTGANALNLYGKAGSDGVVIVSTVKSR